MTLEDLIEIMYTQTAELMTYEEQQQAEMLLREIIFKETIEKIEVYPKSLLSVLED